MKKNCYISFDECSNDFFEILDMDINNEFPFILFIFVARENNQNNYEHLTKKINDEVKNFIYLKDKKNGYKVLVVLVPIDNQTSWKEHPLSNILNIPTSYPTFALGCRQKKCTICKNENL